MGDTVTERSRNHLYAIVGLIIGLLLAVPVSYLFQSELPAAHQGMGNYISTFTGVVTNKSLMGVALVTIGVLGIVGFLFGLFVAGIISGLNDAKASARK